MYMFEILCFISFILRCFFMIHIFLVQNIVEYMYTICYVYIVVYTCIYTQLLTGTYLDRNFFYVYNNYVIKEN